MKSQPGGRKRDINCGLARTEEMGKAVLFWEPGKMSLKLQTSTPSQKILLLVDIK